MFEDSLIESGRKLRTKRGVTTSISFLLELGLVALLVLLPLLFTKALPKAQMMTSVALPPPPPRAAAVPRAARQAETNFAHGQLRIPTRIPEHVVKVEDEVRVAPSIAVSNGLGDSQAGQMNGVLRSILNSSAAAIPKVATPKRAIVSSGVSEGMLIHKVQPPYPPLARQARIQGAVTLQAEIAKDGSIQNLRLLSGHPMLAPAALEAVKEWKYKPYILNGEPVEVETTITVKFSLAGG